MDLASGEELIQLDVSGSITSAVTLETLSETGDDRRINTFVAADTCQSLDLEDSQKNLRYCLRVRG